MDSHYLEQRLVAASTKYSHSRKGHIVAKDGTRIGLEQEHRRGAAEGDGAYYKYGSPGRARRPIWGAAHKQKVWGCVDGLEGLRERGLRADDRRPKHGDSVGDQELDGRLSCAADVGG